MPKLSFKVVEDTTKGTFWHFSCKSYPSRLKIHQVDVWSYLQNSGEGYIDLLGLFLFEINQDIELKVELL